MSVKTGILELSKNASDSDIRIAIQRHAQCDNVTNIEYAIQTGLSDTIEVLYYCEVSSQP